MPRRRQKLRGSDVKAGSGFVPVILLLFVVSILTGMLMEGGAWAAPGDQMIHNSTNTGSTKWPADGGWGISTGKYGAFDCDTCHIKNATNIKRIKSTITTPNTSKGILPGDGQTIIFDRIIGTPGDPGTLGDDSIVPRAAEKHICEVCHTYDAARVNGVNVHASNQPSASDHKGANAKDCIQCHRHNEAFKPLACDSCHGNPPTDATLTSFEGKTTGSATAGKHATHATTLAYSCDNCHSNSVMPNESTVKPGFWDISIGFSNFGVSTGTYSGQNGLSYNNTLSTGGQTCSTVYCHGNTLDGSNKTPTWTSTSTVACGDCHKNNAASMVSSTLGSHARHAGNSSGQLALACTDCHGTNGSGGSGHVSGTVQYDLTGNSARFGTGATYNSAASGTIANVAPSASYQSCSTVYCHSNAQGANGVGAPTAYNSPAWGGTAMSCGGCHENMSGATGTGSHVKHANTYGMTCANCHTGYTASSTNGSLHANATINVDVAATYGGTYNGGTVAGDHAPGGGYGSCSTVYCHSSSQSSTGGALTGGDYKTVAWGSGALTCASCHNDMSAAGGTGSHELHASATGNGQYACSVCHSAGY
ncbi:MAG: CxxxxCH/CxxCH domain-containing protein, partial [Thermodesulfovibrionales bacterium]